MYSANSFTLTQFETSVSLDRKAPSQTSVKSGAVEAVSSKGEVSAAESVRSVSIPPSHVSEQQSEVSEKPKVRNIADWTLIGI